MAMYGATAFIIMEAAEIMLPRLGLPDWTVTLIIVLLLVGFPVTITLLQPLPDPFLFFQTSGFISGMIFVPYPKQMR